MKKIPDELSSLRRLTPPEDEAGATSTCGPVRRQERRVESPKRTRRDWHDVASAFFLFLALAGVVYGVLTHRFGSSSQRTKSVAATSIVETSSPRFKKIQELQLGDRVLGENPQGVKPGETDDTIFERVKHCGYSLTRRDENGDESHIRLLRPADWLETAETRVRNVYSGREVDELDLLLDDFSPLDLATNSYALDVWLELPEMGVVGWCELDAIDEDVAVKSGDGNVVTGTFEHVSNNVIDLYTAASADPIGVTTNHPFWSEDRQDFVPAGELAEGERVLLYNGETKPVVQKLPRPGPQRVYNLEVYSEHVYLVSKDGVLVHNNCPIKLHGGIEDFENKGFHFTYGDRRGQIELKVKVEKGKLIFEPTKQNNDEELIERGGRAFEALIKNRQFKKKITKNLEKGIRAVSERINERNAPQSLADMIELQSYLERIKKLK